MPDNNDYNADVIREQKKESSYEKKELCRFRGKTCDNCDGVDYLGDTCDNFKDIKGGELK